jgi:co-chaperonin GroES (HSP10)
LTTVDKVLKLGDFAYRDENKFPLGAWCKEDDYISFGKFNGQKFVYKGAKLLLLFDDQVIMRVDDPMHLDTTYNLSN